MPKLIIDEYDPELPLDEIDISPGNVRKSGQTKGLKELADNIAKFGLFQPVTVFFKDDRYKLLVGQRRYLACELLRWTTIPAFIIKPLNTKTQTIVSFGENVHRRELPYEDSIQACNKLYNQYTGTKKQRIEKITKDLGITIYEASKFLAHILIPLEVRKLITEGKISENFAYRVTSTYFPDNKKIISIAKQALRMTKAERQRAIEYSKRNPKASVNEILSYAKNPPPFIKLIIHFQPETYARITETAKNRRMSIETYVKNAIDKSLENE